MMTFWNGNIFESYQGAETRTLRVPFLCTITSARFEPKTGAYFSATHDGLHGWLEKDYQITVTDIIGKVLESFRAAAGNVSHAFDGNLKQGVLFIEMKSATESRIVRIPVM